MKERKTDSGRERERAIRRERDYCDSTEFVFLGRDLHNTEPMYIYYAECTYVMWSCVCVCAVADKNFRRITLNNKRGNFLHAVYH